MREPTYIELELDEFDRLSGCLKNVERFTSAETEPWMSMVLMPHEHIIFVPRGFRARRGLA